MQIAWAVSCVAGCGTAADLFGKSMMPEKYYMMHNAFSVDC